MKVKNVRSKISTLRESKNLTQLDLALDVGVTETTIANWEKGRSGLPIIIQLIKLCKALECQLEDLVEVLDPEDNMEVANIGELSLPQIHDMIGIERSAKGRKAIS